MFEFLKKMHKKVALSPGTLTFVGEKLDQPVKVDLIQYDKITINEKDVSDITMLPSELDKDRVSWINFSGIHQVERIETVGKTFNIHPLILEDVVNVYQRPKQEEYDGQLFVILKMITYDRDLQELKYEQVSFLLGDHYLISFQEREGDLLIM